MCHAMIYNECYITCVICHVMLCDITGVTLYFNIAMLCYVI